MTNRHYTIKLTGNQLNKVLLGLSHALDLENSPKTEAENAKVIRTVRSIEKQANVVWPDFEGL